MISNLARIGADVGSLVLISSLNSGNMSCPIMDYKRYIKTDELSSGQTRGGGLPVVDWEFRRLTSAQADALAAYCTNLASANVTIYTRTSRTVDVYKAFNCVMKWDQDETIQDYWRMVMKFRFIDCVEVSYP